MEVNSMPIPGYEGYYTVSDQGIVNSIQRRIELCSGQTRLIEGKQLALQKNNDGYVIVKLSKKDVTITKYVHRLVADAFIANPDNLFEVNHINGDKANNRVDNLCWSSHRDNVIHAYANNLSKNIGGSHYFAVGVVDNGIGMEFATIKEWCAARGINYSTGRNILSGCNKSKVIDLKEVFIVKKKMNSKHGKQ